MAFLPLRSVSLPAAADASYEAWLDELDGQLDAPGADWPADAIEACAIEGARV